MTLAVNEDSADEAAAKVGAILRRWGNPRPEVVGEEQV